MVNRKKKNQRRPKRRSVGLFNRLRQQKSPLGKSPTRRIGDPIRQQTLQRSVRTTLR
ncbi:hypothetical protein LCGC14_1385360 [marine sediment metagenome]|uniref:Uncharacterized protein n=1 Tax=marine sediment metagenome TaxID=412755 RepID=A0A0F9K1J0_9ZZZZ